MFMDPLTLFQKRWRSFLIRVDGGAKQHFISSRSSLHALSTQTTRSSPESKISKMQIFLYLWCFCQAVLDKLNLSESLCNFFGLCDRAHKEAWSCTLNLAQLTVHIIQDTHYHKKLAFLKIHPVKAKWLQCGSPQVCERTKNCWNITRIVKATPTQVSC